MLKKRAEPRAQIKNPNPNAIGVRVAKSEIKITSMILSPSIVSLVATKDVWTRVAVVVRICDRIWVVIPIGAMLVVVMAIPFVVMIWNCVAMLIPDCIVVRDHCAATVDIMATDAVFRTETHNPVRILSHAY